MKNIYANRAIVNHGNSWSTENLSTVQPIDWLKVEGGKKAARLD